MKLLPSIAKTIMGVRFNLSGRSISESKKTRRSDLCNMYWVSRNLSCTPNFRSVSHLLSINWRKRLREAEQEKDRGNVIRGVRACFRPEDKAGRLVATAGGK